MSRSWWNRLFKRYMWTDSIAWDKGSAHELLTPWVLECLDAPKGTADWMTRILQPAWRSRVFFETTPDCYAFVIKWQPTTSPSQAWYSNILYSVLPASQQALHIQNAKLRSKVMSLCALLPQYTSYRTRWWRAQHEPKKTQETYNKKKHFV